MNNRNAIAVIVLLVVVVGSVIWYGLSREDTTEEGNQPVLSVSAFNQTKTADASLVSANPSDIIEFTLKAENLGDEVIEAYTLQADISEVSKGATLIDAGGASYNSANNSLIWTPLNIPVGDSIQSKFTVRVTDSAVDSLSIRYNNQVSISLAHPTVAGKTVTPTPVYAAPSTGPSESIVLSLALAITTSAFLIRRKKIRV